MSYFGGLVKEIRVDKKMSLSEVADISGVAKSTLFRIENGVVDPRLSTIVKIANVFCMEVRFVGW